MPFSVKRIVNSARVAAWSAGEGRIAYAHPEKLAGIQSRRLRKLLRHAWDTVPYYRNWMREAGAGPEDIRCAADLAGLPLVGKSELTLHPERFMAAGWREKEGLTISSSGTSGCRRQLRYDAHAILRALAAGRRQRLAIAPFTGRETGYREADIVREHSVADQFRAFVESLMATPRGLDLKRRYLSPALTFEELLAELNDFRPEVVRGYGSHLGAFFRWVRDRGARHHKPKVITYGADCMPEAERRLIEEDLGIPVRARYQAVEALRIGYECELGEGYHVSIDQVAVRVVDEQGRDAQPGGRGEIVLTNLTNFATPVINYRLGDMVTLGVRPCPCGRTLPLLASVDGRADDLVARPDGTSIHALTLLAPLQSAPGVARVQIIQEALDDFSLLVVWETDRHSGGEELSRRMREILGQSVRIRIQGVDQIAPTPAGKTKHLISHVARP